MSNEGLGIRISTTYNMDIRGLKEALERLSQQGLNIHINGMSESIKMLGKTASEFSKQACMTSMSESIKMLALTASEFSKQYSMSTSELLTSSMKYLSYLTLTDIATTIKNVYNEDIEVVDDALLYEGNTYTKEEINSQVEDSFNQVLESENWEHQELKKSDGFVNKAQLIICIGQLCLQLVSMSIPPTPINNFYDYSTTVYETNNESSTLVTCEYGYANLFEELYNKAKEEHDEIVGVELARTVTDKTGDSTSYQIITDLKLQPIDLNLFLEDLKLYCTIETCKDNGQTVIKYIANGKFAELNK
ncbi:MAG: hypothetical protein CVV02_05920 [Firmicutes bacterium HGW-Firmicutes-7]|nr:MAG: hypothetical protein CVV02_05920 [Firmicutes bacterium HGW-Firmicutes-7]